MAKKKKLRYPSKTTLNLAIREKTLSSPSRFLPLVLLLAVMIGLFTKFAVLDRLLAVSRAQSEIDALQAQLIALDSANAGYDELLVEYARHSTSWMTAEELALVDSGTVFDLIDREVLPSAELRSFSLESNVLTLDLTQLSLRDASDIVTRLQARDDVTNVAMYTAAGGAALDNTRTGSVTMQIGLTNGNAMPSEREHEGGGAE